MSKTITTDWLCRQCRFQQAEKVFLLALKAKNASRVGAWYVQGTKTNLFFYQRWLNVRKAEVELTRAAARL